MIDDKESWSPPEDRTRSEAMAAVRDAMAEQSRPYSDPDREELRLAKEDIRAVEQVMNDIFMRIRSVEDKWIAGKVSEAAKAGA